MAYDHATEQTAPGPIAPLPWVRTPGWESGRERFPCLPWPCKHMGVSVLFCSQRDVRRLIFWMLSRHLSR